MVHLKLDPRYPLVWRSPEAMQLGGRRPLIVLDPISPAEERMLAALTKGVPDSSLLHYGRCTQREASELIARLGPGLHEPPPAPSLAITVRARDEQGRQLAEQARSLGLLGHVSAGDTARPREAGIVIGAHAIPPSAYRDWLRRDIPHLGIELGATDARVSQVVVPGQTPCLRCADLHRRDEDPCWPAVAAQLITRQAAAAEDPVLRIAVLVTAVRRLRAAIGGWAAGPHPIKIESRGLQFTADGAATVVEAPPHPECGCLVDLQLPSRSAAAR